MAWTVNVSDSELKRARKFPRPVQDWIAQTALALQNGPAAVGAVRLQDRQVKAWKVRHGDYRLIVVEVGQNELSIPVIDHRKQACERFHRIRKQFVQ